MSIDITSKNIFTLFNNKNNNSNLAYISITDNNNITLTNTKTSLSLIGNITISPTVSPTTSLDTGIIFRPEPNLYIDKYTTLQIQYLIEGPATNVSIQFKNINEVIEPEGTTFTLATSDSKQTKNLHFFTKDILNFTIHLFFSTGSTNGIVIKEFNLFSLEGDQMEYIAETTPDTFNIIENNLYLDVSGGVNSYGVTVSGIHKSLYLPIPNLTTTTISGVTLFKSFTDIDYPDYLIGQSGQGISGYTTGLINSSTLIVGNNNLNIPIGYNYLWQFIFNDITFTSIPSLELSGIYGRFNQTEYYDTSGTYETIVMGATDPPGTNYELGYKIKLKLPAVDSSGIFNSLGINHVDERNSYNYILKKINIIFIQFHNAMFDYFYNNVDLSGTLNTVPNPLIEHAHAPRINTDGTNSKSVFEFIRKNVILHYHSMIIYDVLDRYCDSKDVTTYFKEQVCTVTNTDASKLSVEFIELIRLLTQFDQNELRLSNTNNVVQRYSLYDRTKFNTYDTVGTTVSGILWGNIFKTMVQLPRYSKKILPQIHVTDSSGNSLSSYATNISGIQDLQAYYYFANTRSINNKIASGQQIRTLITDGENNKLCSILPDLFKNADIDNLLSTHNLLTYTPYIYYILYESLIYTRGSTLSKNGIASNILLKNMFQCFYNSVINYTKFYIRNTPQLFDFNSGGVVDISGNIRIGAENSDSSMKTVGAIYMRDIIRAATSSDVSGIQHYHIINTTMVFSPFSQYKESIDTNNFYIYVSKDDYNRFRGLKHKVYTLYNSIEYFLVDCREKNYPLSGTTQSITYQLKLNHPSSTYSIPDEKVTLIFYSNIET